MRAPKQAKILARTGKRIKAARVARGITQEDAAHRSGIDYKRWQRIEAGKAYVTLLMLGRLAGVLRIRPGKLVR